MADNPYKEKIDLVASGIKPELLKRMASIASQTLAFALVLASEWSAGDDVAGKILDDFGLKAIGKTSSLAEQVGISVSEGGFMTPKAWWSKNLDALADGLLVPEIADKLKIKEER